MNFFNLYLWDKFVKLSKTMSILMENCIANDLHVLNFWAL